MTITALRAGGIDLQQGSGTCTIRLWGEVDGSLRSQASTALAGALAQNEPVVVDASEVTFIDSMGGAFLIQLCTLERDEGVSVTFRDPAPVVSSLLAMICGPERDCMSEMSVLRAA